MRIMTFLTIALALGAVGCGSAGELERGAFSYQCVATEDPLCWDGTTGDIAMPGAVAISASFAVNFAPGSGAGAHTVAPASTRLGVRLPEGTLQLSEAGRQALLARDQQGFIKDFAFVQGSRVRGIRVTEERDLQAMPLTTITVAQGVVKPVYLRGVTSNGGTLAGGITFSARTEDPMTVGVTINTDTSELNIHGGVPGVANVFISTGAYEEIIVVQSTMGTP